MSNVITLKSFPFDAIEELNAESGQMEPDRLYEAEIFRRYFAKFLSNGVYFGHYKNYGEDSMKVTPNGGLNVRVHKGCGIIQGADFENEEERVFILERPVSGVRCDSIVVKLDKTLGIRETQLYVKEGNGSTPATLQRDDNIYEICLAEVTVKSSSNIVQSDIKDTREDYNLCGVVNILTTIFKDVIKANGGIEGNVKGNLEGNAETATTASNCTGNSTTATTANSAKSCTRKFRNSK